MIGALAGDILGSVHEGVGTKVTDFALFQPRCRPTDDSVLTLAVAAAIVARSGRPTERDYAVALRAFGRRYPDAGYGGSFRRWLVSDDAGPYQSWGNGSAMRVAPVGWAYASEAEVLAQAAATAAPTHNHPEGIKGAQAVALAVYLARTGADKPRIRGEIERRFGYNLHRSADQVRPSYGFDVSCQGSVPESIIAFLDSTGVEDAIRIAISLGGDADTQACMAGAIAEAHYGGVPEPILAFVLPRLDDRLLDIAVRFARLCLPGSTRGALEREARSRLPRPRGPAPRPTQRGVAETSRRPERREGGEAAAAAWRVVLGSQAWRNVGDLAQALNARDTAPGANLAAALEALAPPRLDAPWLLEALLASKKPRVFAESEVRGDAGDWTPRELAILGDIAVAVPVTIYDDGRHEHPRVHGTPFRGNLLYVPGALLRNGHGMTPADAAVVDGGHVDVGRYRALYERRLVPVLKYASAAALRGGHRAFVTIPGLGCGQFAGKFQGTLGALLEEALADIIERHAPALPGIRAVWFDPYGECRERRRRIGHISFLVRPLRHAGHGLPQLCPPVEYAEDGDDFGDCVLSSVVAWDHVSWPGNDFYDGSRSTDDGVKAAATDSMFALTGFRGTYDAGTNCYNPPSGYRTWGDLVTRNRLRLSAMDRLLVVDAGGTAASTNRGAPPGRPA